MPCPSLVGVVDYWSMLMAESRDAHYHWEFLAYDKLLEEGTKGYFHACTVTVIGYRDEESASLAVQSLVTRKHYDLRRVWECTTCEYLENVAASMHRLAKSQES